MKFKNLSFLIVTISIIGLLSGCSNAASELTVSDIPSQSADTETKLGNSSVLPAQVVEEESSAETDGEIQMQETDGNSVIDEQFAGEFDLENGTVILNSGYEMPILGIGTYRLSNEEAENSVYWALRDGYRLIDTARIYGNEEGVGRGIQRAINEGIVKREDIFITTKMWTDDYGNGA